MSSFAVRTPDGFWRGIFLLIVQIAVGYVAFMWLAMQALNIAGCGDRCDYGLVAFAMNSQFWVAVGGAIVSAVTLVWLSLRSRRSVWVPSILIGITVIACILNTIAIQVATKP